MTVSLTVVNDAPTAVDDSYNVYENGSLTVVVPGILANDTDPNGDALTASPLTGIGHGALVLSANGSFTYTPLSGYTGTDSFTYAACDAQSACDGATVTITIVTPDAPIAMDDYAYAVPGNSVVIQALLNDLAGSGPLDPTSLQVTSGPSHGTATVNAGGSVTYLTAGGVGSDTFNYRICNTVSPTCATATVYVTIDRAPIFGPGVDGSTISSRSAAHCPAPWPFPIRTSATPSP